MSLEEGNLFKDAGPTTDVHPSVWIKTMRDKLFTMFCSPLKDDYFQEAFKWVAQLCMTLDDFSWIVPDGQWTPKTCQIFSCIVKLSMNEIQILMPMIERHLTVGNEPELEGGKILARSANSADYDKLGSHLIIMESAIKSLIKNMPDEETARSEKLPSKCLTDVLDNKELQGLLEQLMCTMTLILNYLELVHRYWSRIIEQKESEMYSCAEATIRIVCVWLSEDSDSFQPQCRRFIIDLIINSLSSDNSQHDIYLLALHSVCTNDQESLAKLRSNATYRHALEKYLQHIQKERKNSKVNETRRIKMFKLRCGLVKDLLSTDSS